MRADAINSIVTGLSSQQPAAGSNSILPEKQAVPVDTPVTLSGQLRLNGVTAHFEVRNGDKVMYSLVEDATGRFLGQFSPSTGLGISAAIDEILNRHTATGDSTREDE